MAPAAALATRKLPTRLTSRTPRSSAAVRSATGPTETPPAAWTTSVSGPRDRAASMLAATEASSVTSQAGVPSPGTTSAAWQHAPAAVKAVTPARPMPPAAPVTSATRPASGGPSVSGPLDKLHHHLVRGVNIDVPEAPPVSPWYLDRGRMGGADPGGMQLRQQSVQVVHLQAHVGLAGVVHPAVQRAARGAEVPEELDETAARQGELRPLDARSRQPHD